MGNSTEYQTGSMSSAFRLELSSELEYAGGRKGSEVLDYNLNTLQGSDGEWRGMRSGGGWGKGREQRFFFSLLERTEF